MAPKYKLTYFDSPGLAEPIRFLFAYGGVEYEDHRMKREDWPALKSSTPFGRVPLLEVDGKAVHQSVAICRYLAKQFKIAGENDWESLQCDMIVETVGDLRLLAMKVIHEPDEKKKKEKMTTFHNEEIPFYLDKFEEHLAKNPGHFVGGKLTWTDLYVVSTLEVFEEFMKVDIFGGKYPNLKKVKDSVVGIPSIKSWVERRPKWEYQPH